MRKPTFISSLVWLNGAVPAALLINDAFNHRLGANPVNFAILTTGLLSLIFLTLTLTVTPIRQLTGWTELFPARRTLGLLAAFYAFAHFGIFYWWDRAGSVSSTLHEITVRKYLWFGTTALLVFVPLTLTSTHGALRRLGAPAWKWLHRLVYVAAIGAAVHYMMQGKFVSAQSIVFASVIGALLLYRLVASEVKLRQAYAKLQHSPSPVVGKPKFWKGQLRVVRVFDETPEVRTFRLAPVDGSTLPFDYRPGQYLNLSLTVDGKPVNRSYTIASSPSRAGVVELTVKREEMGTSSRHLHQAIRVGDLIQVSAPAGKFIFEGHEADSIVMIAGGVGITPLMSKIRYLTDRAWPGEIYLLFSTRTERDIIFREELDYIARRHPNLHVTVTLTRASDDWKGERGRVTADLIRRVIPSPQTRRFHICGPTEMADTTRAMLLSMGVPDAMIAMESFTSPKVAAGAMSPAVMPASVPVNGDAHTVTFAKSGKMVEVPPDQVLLEAAEGIDVPIDFDCRSGICGQCKTRLLSGEVVMETEDALTPADRKAGFILACQARCTEDVTVDA